MDFSVLSPAAAAIRKDCQRLCQVSKSLTEPDEALLAKFLEAMWAHQKSKGAAVVSGAAGRAVLFGYQADSTPLRATCTIVKTHKQYSVRRQGKTLHDVLLQRGFLMAKCWQ